jgi:hypothetical protein
LCVSVELELLLNAAAVEPPNAGPFTVTVAAVAVIRMALAVLAPLPPVPVPVIFTVAFPDILNAPWLKADEPPV